MHLSLKMNVVRSRWTLQVKVDRCNWGSVFIGVAPRHASAWNGYGFLNYRACQAYGSETLYGAYYAAGAAGLTRTSCIEEHIDNSVHLCSGPHEIPPAPTYFVFRPTVVIHGTGAGWVRAGQGSCVVSRRPCHGWCRLTIACAGVAGRLSQVTVSVCSWTWTEARCRS